MTFHPDLLTGRTALVTGGTSGIGKAIACALAELGCNVVATGLTSSELNACDTDGWPITLKQLDVADTRSIAEAAEQFQELDVLVNCAGMILRENREHDPIQFAKVIDVNLNGTMRVCAACHPLLERRRGCVVNIASMLSYFGSGFVPAYSASKGGIAQLTKSLAIAWADDGIRVNAVAPGWIRTALTETLYGDRERSRQLVERTPLRRWGTPEDVAGAVLFLCSDAARFMTGVILPVDGGYSIA